MRSLLRPSTKWAEAAATMTELAKQRKRRCSPSVRTLRSRRAVAGTRPDIYWRSRRAANSTCQNMCRAFSAQQCGRDETDLVPPSDLPQARRLMSLRERGAKPRFRSRELRPASGWPSFLNQLRPTALQASYVVAERNLREIKFDRSTRPLAHNYLSRAWREREDSHQAGLVSSCRRCRPCRACT